MQNQNRFRRIILPNGLTLLLFPINEVFSIFISLYVRVGADYEKQSERGLSHFTEHSAFLGTKKFPSHLDLSYQAQRIGANFNGLTDRFMTNYWVKLPYTHSRKGLEFLYDLAMNPNLNNTQINKERNVVLAEYNDSWSNPENRFWHKIWRKRFKQKEHPYSYQSLGIPETINTFDKKTIIFWRNKYYQPNNMILSVAGNFEPEKAESIIRELFGKLKKGYESKEPRFPSNDYSDFLIYDQPDPRNQITFYLSFPLKGWKEITRKERMEIKRLNYIFGAGSSSRLFQRLRLKDSLVYSVNSKDHFHPWMGAFEIWGSTGSDQLTSALSAIKEEILRIKNYGVEKNELLLANNMFNSSNLLTFDNPKDIADSIGDQEFDQEEIWFPEKYAAVGNQITVDDLNKVAKKFFDFSKVNIGLLGNVSNQRIKEVKEIFIK